MKLFLINMYGLIDARILDKNAEYLGLNMEKLMENAGKAVADVVLSLKPKNVLVVCGSGNNGGDGYVTAINLKKNGVNVDVYMAKMPKSQLCIKKYNEAKEEGVNIVNFFDPSKYDVIVDAMLGIGIEKDPEEPYRSLIEKINVSGKTIVSVDVPTGIGTNVSIKPDITVTMQFSKREMNEKNSGKIIVADVGFPRELLEMVGPGEFVSYKFNPDESHKGENGILVGIAGSVDYYGAPIYMSKGALRMGIDLLFLFSPEYIHNYISSSTHDIILKKSGERYIEFNNELKRIIEDKATAVALGCGIGKNEVSQESSTKIIEESLLVKKPIVIDADALDSVTLFDDLKGLAVITPHRGEFKRIFSIDPDENNVVKMAKKYNLVILLKGSVDIISDGEIVKKNKSFHHPSMTRGGTGDILTGAVGGLLSRGIDPFHSATLASFIVGSAGKLAFEEKSNSYFTSEVIDMIPQVFRKHVQ